MRPRASGISEGLRRGGGLPRALWTAAALSLLTACAAGADTANSGTGSGGASTSSGSGGASTSSGSGGSGGQATTSSGGGMGGGAAGAGGEGGALPRAPAPGEVVFIEMMQDPATLSDFVGEWFELKNVSAVPLQLGGCSLTDLGTNGDNHVIAAGDLVIDPGQILVFAKTADPQQNGQLPDVAYAFGDFFSLTNTGDEARLECGGALIDEVIYTPTWPYAAGVSMQLDPTKETAADNDIAASWCAATISYYPSELGTPGSDAQHCQ